MNSLKVLGSARALNCATRICARNLSLTSCVNKWGLTKKGKDDSHVFDSMVKNLEREFDMSRKRILRSLGMGQGTGQSIVDNFMDDFNYDDRTKIHTDKDGNRKFQLVFDMNPFTPEEIKVRTKAHSLTIEARKEQTTDSDYYLRDFSQSYTLPKDLKIEDLKTRWNDDGVLVIEAILPQLTGGETKFKSIPIEHGGRDDSSINKETPKISAQDQSQHPQTTEKNASETKKPEIQPSETSGSSESTGTAGTTGGSTAPYGPTS